MADPHSHSKPADKSPKPAAAPKEPKPAETKTPVPPTQEKTSDAKAAEKAPKKPEAKTEAKADDVKIVEKATEKKHTARAKPTLTKEQQAGLRLRDAVSGRRPKFRRQQWYEYKRLANSGWRRPRGVDSAMRRHFGYEQPVVRVGFRGPASVRGLHPSGFEEVRIEHVAQLEAIDPKRQAARVAGQLGTRTLRLVYAEADKRGIRILNRRNLP